MPGEVKAALGVPLQDPAPQGGDSA
jgi:hypothetical protein